MARMTDEEADALDELVTENPPKVSRRWKKWRWGYNLLKRRSNKVDERFFKTRDEFRSWLTENALSDNGLWLVFDKRKRTSSLSANDALEEALCFGWIDGQMESIDAQYYKKYFKRRGKDSKWSDKNKGIVEKLESQKLMTEYGRERIAYAKENGLWDSPQKEEVTDEHIRQFEDMLKPYQPAYANFMEMTRSIRKAYAGSYFLGAKTDAGKQKRFAAIIERLNMNLNPMESLKKKIEKES